MEQDLKNYMHARNVEVIKFVTQGTVVLAVSSE